ncbi:MAG TPA: hypothetical protein VHX62_16955 [Solirubrobacteraceae bacterium]|jgi:Tfp pilus assembly protein PilN|nr:hypothetical protein [Solirubrobacteraceae bacterium]
MNAVNLIPSDRRRRRVTISASPATMGIVGGLVLVLVASLLYVLAANQVNSRRGELGRVTANANSWKVAADSYQSYVSAAQARTAELADVKSLATQRYQWSVLLSQIGALMPANSELGSLNATTSSSTSGSTATPASTTTAAAGTPVPTVQISGCAASQSAVAQTMVQLHRIPGVSAVSLSSSTDSGGSGSGSCAYPVSYAMSLTFSAPSPAASASSVAPTGATSTASGSTAASATTTTGAAQ